MATLLNVIIATGGTTAMTAPVTGADLRDWMRQPDTIWHVAEVAGDIAGFQWIGPHPETGACDIATFVAEGRHGLGIGSALFQATRGAARAAGYRRILADIRADNAGGLAYYCSRGFEPHGRRDGIRLGDGTRVDKVILRHALT